MGIISYKNPCVKCGSSDARQIYDTGTSFCFSCHTAFKEDTGESMDDEFEVVKSVRNLKPPQKKSNSLSLEEIQELKTKGIPERKIGKTVLDFFGVKMSFNADGETEAHYYPYGADAYKIRKLPKEFSWVGKSKDLFGMHLFNSSGRRLIITEGELDALSMAQSSFDKYDKIYPVVALSSASATKSILEHREWIRSFGEVILCFDTDDAGKVAQAEAIRIIGIDKVKLWKPPPDCKDACDVYLKHGTKVLMGLIFDAAPYIPAGIVGKEALWEALANYNAIASHPYPPCMGGVNEKLKGKRFGEITLFTSGTGCFAQGTEILMFNGSLKRVEDVIPGDTVMGPNSTPRNVVRLCRGRELMARVTLRDDTSFVCNTSHVMTLVNNDGEGRWGLKKDQLVDVRVDDYLRWSDKRKHLSKAFKVGRLDFGESIDTFDLHPYVLGAWLGDGTGKGAVMTCHSDNVAIIEKMMAHGVYFYKSEADNLSYNSPGGFRAQLQNLGVFGNKHIPEVYLRASVSCRLELLAGLIDTDGHYGDAGRNTYEFSQKSLDLTEQVARLACSLGFTTAIGKQKNNKFGNCYRLWISGEGLEDIPVALAYKKARPRLQIKNPHRYSFKVEILPEDDFYGFEVDGDNRFVLGNFVVTHNSGKSSLLREIILDILETTPDSKIGIISLEESPHETARKIAGMCIGKNPAREEIPLAELKVGFDKAFGTDRITVLDHQGSISDNSIVEQLEYMALSGCRYLFIDHITILVSEGVENLTGNEAVDKMMNELLRLVKRHDIWIGLVSHLRKVQSGKTAFEEGQLPSLDDIKGSGSIKQISFDIIAFARNMTAQDENERNHIKMRVLKSRYTGLTGDCGGMQYEYETGRMYAAANQYNDEFTSID